MTIDLATLVKDDPTDYNPSRVEIEQRLEGVLKSFRHIGLAQAITAIYTHESKFYRRRMEERELIDLLQDLDMRLNDALHASAVLNGEAVMIARYRQPEFAGGDFESAHSTCIYLDESPKFLAAERIRYATMRALEQFDEHQEAAATTFTS